MGIYVWGTGCGAGDFIGQGFAAERVAAFVDSAPGISEFMGRPVIAPEALDPADVELMVVASRHAAGIRKQCIGLGIGSEKLFFLKNHYLLQNLNENEALAEALLGAELVAKTRQNCRIVRVPMGCPDGALEEKDLDND